MTNAEYLFYYAGFKELARHMVHIQTEDIYDYDHEDNLEDTGWDEIWYVTPDNDRFQDENEAINHTVEWLNAEYIDNYDED